MINLKMTRLNIILIIFGVVFFLIGVGILIYFLSRKNVIPIPPPVPPVPPIPPVPGIPTYDQQPDSSVFIQSNSTSTMYIYIEYANFNGAAGRPTLNPPDQKWKIIRSNGVASLGDPVNYYPASNPPIGTSPPYVEPNDVGSATWQILTLAPGSWVILGIPNFTRNQAWSIRPLKYINGKPCSGSPGCGMPSLIEAGFEMVADMSLVDGVNYLLKYTFSTPKGPTTIDFKANPCRAIGLNPTGCKNPYVDGSFKPGTDWRSQPCPAGTCNLIEPSRTWSDTIHFGQCSNSNTIDGWSQNGGPSSCRNYNLFTAYSYSHDDSSSSPTFSAPYKMRLIYSDLV